MFSRLRRLAAATICAFAALACTAGTVSAHPHIWIDARGELVFEDERLVGMRHFWTFDPYFSAWAIQGLDADGDGVLTTEELQPLADENMEGLAFYDFYTFAGADQDRLEFSAVRDHVMAFDEGRLKLAFTLDFADPIRVGRDYDISVGDPEYYAAFTFEGANAVTMAGAPEGCLVEVSEPRPIAPELEEQLFNLGADVTVLPDELRQAARDLANLVTVSCPTGPAENAIDAITDATARTMSGPVRAPFAAPPTEPGAAPGQGGVLGWIADRQAEFYQLLTGALATLHEDNNAFWILGGLSFLYGVFHAAGPGHGKVVISTYVLANERQLRRGVALSIASAGMQALVAIGFVSIAAGLLRLTSMAMSDAAMWMTAASYGLVALLGAWLSARKIMRFGHVHAPAHAHAHAYAGAGGHGAGHHDHHRHGNDHAHGEGCSHHVVLPDQTRGDWRESLGVVMSVGMRPCSGALVILVFALTQGLYAAGIVSTFLMAAGTALTVAALASLAVGAKGLAARLAGGGARAGRLLWWGELAAALAVMGFGLVLLFATLG